MKWCSGSTAAQCMLTESGCRNNASINWGLYELRLQKTHLSHISQTALLFRKLRNCQHQSTLQATVKDDDDTVNIQQLTDQYIVWQWTIKPAFTNYRPSEQFHNDFCLYMLSEICLGDHANQPATFSERNFGQNHLVYCTAKTVKVCFLYSRNSTCCKTQLTATIAWVIKLTGMQVIRVATNSA